VTVSGELITKDGIRIHASRGMHELLGMRIRMSDALAQRYD
jgi:hypothetical protein